ncbi:MAG: Ig-like domain-containing protein [Chitinophagaceae bacterium]|nr:Ig-like domain-containing protein [Chitinophagaceae bacterium]
MKHLFPTTTIGFLLAIVVLANLPGITGCASIVPPTGGDRDSLPPLLLSVTPPDSSKNFEGKRINFTFNEFVQIDNPLANLLITPTPKTNPNVEAKLRTVSVIIRDTLEPNTTYTFDFGDAIRDINESNILRNFTYIFSTGPSLDSLSFSGRIIIAETGKTDSTLLIFLYRSLDDSAVVKERPRYITRVDNNGNFLFRNLPPGRFAIYGIKDDGGQKRYLSRTQIFAFADTPVVVQPNPTPVTLYAFVARDTSAPAAPATPIKSTGVKGIATDKRLRLETSLQNEQLDLLDSFHFYFRPAPFKFFDTSKLRLTDEKYTPLTNYSFVKDTSGKQVTLFYPWTENTAFNLIIDKDFAEDTAGRKLLRNDTLNFRTKKEKEYGLVRLRFPNLDLTKSPVLLFIQNDKVVRSHVFTNKEFYAKIFQPGEYELRLLFDENKNGEWDTGEFFGNRRQPEKVMPISRKITVKANWDNEVDITLPNPP